MNYQKSQNNNYITSWFWGKFLRKKWSVLQGHRYFGAKSKGYNTTMKRAVKKHSLGIRDILRNKRKASKALVERVCAVTKKIFKAGKVFVTTIQKVDIKMLFTAFCYNLY